MTLEELLLECVDAIRVAPWDCDCRQDHLRQLGAMLARNDISEEDRGFLRAAARQFERNQHRRPVDFVYLDRREELALANDIEARLGGIRYVFHGTIYGRLKGIAAEGFVPGKIKVWGSSVSSAFLDSAVFFTRTWRGAMNFAQVTHSRSRGRRASLHRTPVVVRIPADGLALQKDPASTYPDCLMVSGRVPVEDAHMLLGEVRGYPSWIPLEDALETSRPRRG